jgi:hypothetical protein
MTPFELTQGEFLAVLVTGAAVLLGCALRRVPSGPALLLGAVAMGTTAMGLYLL